MESIEVGLMPNILNLLFAVKIAVIGEKNNVPEFFIFYRFSTVLGMSETVGIQ